MCISVEESTNVRPLWIRASNSTRTANCKGKCVANFALDVFFFLSSLPAERLKVLSCLNSLRQQHLDEMKVDEMKVPAPPPSLVLVPAALVPLPSSSSQPSLVVVASEKPRQPEKLLKWSVKSFTWAPGSCKRLKEQMSCLKRVKKLPFRISLCKVPFGFLC